MKFISGNEITTSHRFLPCHLKDQHYVCKAMEAKAVVLLLILSVITCECTFTTKCPGELVCTSVKSCNDVGKKYRCAAGSVCCSSIRITGKNNLPSFFDFIGIEPQVKTESFETTTYDITTEDTTISTTPATASTTETVVKPKETITTRKILKQATKPETSDIQPNSSRPQNPRPVHRNPNPHFIYNPTRFVLNELHQHHPLYRNVLLKPQPPAPTTTTPQPTTTTPQPMTTEKPILLDPILQSILFGPSREPKYIYSKDIDNIPNYLPNIMNKFNKLMHFPQHFWPRSSSDETELVSRMKRSANPSATNMEEDRALEDSPTGRSSDAPIVLAPPFSQTNERSTVRRQFIPWLLYSRLMDFSPFYNRIIGPSNIHSDLGTGRSGNPGFYPISTGRYHAQNSLPEAQYPIYTSFDPSTGRSGNPSFYPVSTGRNHAQTSYSEAKPPTYTLFDPSTGRSGNPGFYPISTARYHAQTLYPQAQPISNSYEKVPPSETYDKLASKYNAPRSVNVQESRPVVINMIQYQGIDMKLLEMMCQARTISC